MGRKALKRGEIWTADLRSLGEISKIRPALIVSVAAINEISPIVIVIPISSHIPEILGFDRILLEKDNNTNLAKDSVALTTQIRSLEKRKLGKRVGKLKREKMREVEESIKVVLGLTED
ncbi:MAG: hypothetical protein A3A58_02915 [Candidatus Blackburnbacteria bacterium RIFCSPLOWO2_01_FULL_41_27]|uniref:mRNA interferase n=2 Tax=Candidatus Blackburniibacteriota TaxID=1817898 RepID=A0A1G1V6G2_9BACT|nr:MAG: hypothetical protein A3F61_01970 [Candidatus Blackburnbacteria bacterium RIFCSPHIGHO2_12_FULL_41_13b]OGY12884.1 MAG: hypothetical protein A3A58_02915 [Candidatus Blackburnbacteria bacterium RIFCSPLOWO2_01_FULL_41_27]